MKRNRIIYATAVIAVMALGILSRQYPDRLPAVLGKYPGDALWAVMIYLEPVMHSRGTLRGEKTPVSPKTTIFRKFHLISPLKTAVESS